jgi:hypothetical protein
MSRYTIRDSFQEIDENKDTLNSELQSYCEQCCNEFGPSQGLALRAAQTDSFKGMVYLRFSGYLRRRRNFGDDRSILEIFLEWLSDGGAELIIQIIQAIMALFVV